VPRGGRGPPPPNKKRPVTQPPSRSALWRRAPCETVGHGRRVRPWAVARPAGDARRIECNRRWRVCSTLGIARASAKQISIANAPAAQLGDIAWRRAGASASAAAFVRIDRTVGRADALVGATALWYVGAGCAPATNGPSKHPRLKSSPRSCCAPNASASRAGKSQQRWNQRVRPGSDRATRRTDRPTRQWAARPG
jgi:hypothetical protein